MFSPDGKYIATGGYQDVLTILDAQSLETVKTYQVPDVILSRVKWHPTQNKLAVITQSTTFKAKILDLDHDQWTALSGLNSASRAVDWNYTGEYLAVSDLEGIVSIFDTSGNLISSFRGDKKGVTDLDWHPLKNELVAVGSQIGIYNLEGDTLNSFYPTEKEIFMLCVEWHPSGDFFVIGDYGDLEKAENKALRFWNVKGEKLHEVTGSKGEYRNIRWSPDGNKLATATDKLGIYTKDGELINASISSEDYLWGVDWSPDGKQVITSSSQGKITLWNNKAEKIKNVDY
ncbi:hypothetical protein GCM10007940_28060 [Portibacter lacus]|uniref:Translation initiation factor beta propellor-like domain-containing protein n=2 Tax=Portibacter lacus TaxID=1099794 RepID=A0AA37WDU2_9BACT|nr:hypothetical protein GCM10007940_28060 [Portibacter lacus]